jgi:hypothetical protein
MVGASDAQSEHGFGVRFFPPASGQYESLLNLVPMTDGNFKTLKPKRRNPC